MFFIEKTTDLNSETFNEKTEYYIIPKFGPQGGYLRKLSSEIRGSKFHEVEMIRDRTGQNLIDAVIFQKYFALTVCNALESRFEDNHIMTAFKVLAPITMSSTQISLANWGVLDLELLCGQYEVKRKFGGRKIHPLIKSVAIKREFFAFKLQVTTDWLDKSFKDVWSMIIWNPTLKMKYENLLVLAEIARVQCISTVSCEILFLVQNCIKTKQRNRMMTSNLESVLRIALEGPTEDCHKIINKVIGI